jgi:uncharacterized RDD family membrane protein YckC
VSKRQPPPLFDLPLFKDEREEEPAAEETREKSVEAPASVAGDPFPFDLDGVTFGEPVVAASAEPEGDDFASEAYDGEASADGATPTAAADHRPRPAPLVPRFAAALLDGGVLLTVAAIAIVGTFLLGIRWHGEDLPPLLLFLAVFSLLYSTVPLAFWGRTPGMALMRLSARAGDGGPLTFGQTALRWLGGLLTLLLAGLPLLLAASPLGGRSLADRLSGTRCWLDPLP